MNGITDSGERVQYGGAMREPATGKGRFDLISPFALRRLALRLELGADKYSSRNWENPGITFSRFLDSAKRHINQYEMGMEDEDHLASACFNLFAIMHHEELNQTEYDDLPHYLKKKGGGA
jgi:hypothetical protein